MMVLPQSDRRLPEGSLVTFVHRPPENASPVDQWMERAVAGDKEAQFRVGYMYHHGAGVDPDYVRALEWYRRAAEQGHAEAQMSLAVLYAMGQGVARDDVTSYMWFRVASAKVPDRGAAGLRMLEGRMTTQQVEEAKKRAEEWTKSHVSASGR